MSRFLAIPLLLGVLALGADLPEAYQIILRRDVFNPRRVPLPVRDSSAAAAIPVAPPETLTLVGVAVADGKASALFSGSTAELSGTRHPGEPLGSGRIVSIDTDGVTFEADAVSTLRLRVGQTLRRTVGQAWQASVAPAAVPEVQTVANPPPSTGPVAASAPPADGAAPGDMLKQLMERRKRELAP